MSTENQEPTFNLKVAVQETGLKPDTLRAWEKRYGLPQPKRTAGGHRLYSQRDINTLKWLVARQQEGLSISRAVELWRKLAADGQDPLQVSRPLSSTLGEVVRPSPVDAPLLKLRQDWISACLAFDEPKAEQILSQAFALYPVEIVCLELLLKGLADIGQGWYEGAITVQQEHFASELAMRRLEALLAASPAPTRPGRILLGCPPEEEHTFGSLLLTLFLRRRGWVVLYLGANVPVARLQATITTVKPNLVILVAQQLSTAANLLEMGRMLQATRVPLAFGGLIFNRLPELRSRIPGYFLGERFEEAIPQVEQWLTSASPLPPVVEIEPVAEAYQQALTHYREREGMIEAEVWQAMQQTDLPPACLADANRHLACNIAAALTLGELDLLNTEIAWGEELMRHYHLPADLLPCYLRVYYQAAKTHLNEQGRPLVEWLAQL